ncbi:putative Acetate--CoA ligase [Blattamonas nauphoetae]|uniref:Acetate--CoA ligase n=1 Tax=Blattamonas nauphoetae TaxID=2049346 RepID=A0ABQ9X8L9_9EUKA|nr:putative Acetate--CoA ligase [Blattamonas nauphoetae]
MSEKLRMDGFFNPTSLAIIGASQKENTPGWAMARTALETFKLGPVYFVNPRGGKLFEQECYKTISDIPAPKVDLAVIAVAAKFTPASVEELAAKKGCKYVVIVSGGFAEVDEAGSAYQNQVKELCQKYGIRVIGPNCVGIYSPFETIDCLFIEGSLATRPKPGNISFATQSGGFGMCMFNELYNMAPEFPWFGRLVSLGNSCDVCEADFMEFFENDERTAVSTFYLEGFKQSQRFLEAARRSVMKGKPVLVVKSGKNEAGSHALKSHSASLAADDKVTDALLKQYGIIRCEGWKDMFQLYATSFACGATIKGKNIQIVTNGGGQGVQLADGISQFGMNLANISTDVSSFLKSKFPPFYIVANPFDLTGSGTNDEFMIALETMAKDDSNDAIVLNLISYLSQIDPISLTKRLVEKFGRHVPNRKPLFFVLIGAATAVREECTKMLLDAGIPIFDSEIDAARCMSAMYHFEEFRNAQLKQVNEDACHDCSQAKVKITEILASAQKELKEGQDERALLEHEAYGILNEMGLPLPHYCLATSAKEGEDFVSKAYPGKEREAAEFVVKIVSPAVLHKTEAGGVFIGIPAKEGSVGESVDKMLTKFKDVDVRGALVCEMVPPRPTPGASRPKGVELIVGMNTDPTFGKILLVGIGGVLVEVLQDVTFGSCPMTHGDALAMIDRLKSQKMLNGYRGMPVVDRAQLASLMVKVSQLAAQFPQINSIDFNPVIAGDGKLWVVDARIMVSRC